jgi:hypothetical protein
MLDSTSSQPSLSFLDFFSSSNFYRNEEDLTSTSWLAGGKDIALPSPVLNVYR